MAGKMITADDVVKDIAKGVRNALQTSKLLLGAEAIETDHPKIKPEYLVTVEVGKQLSSQERIVSFESHMDVLKANARRTAQYNAMLKYKSKVASDYIDRCNEIDTILSDEEFDFGKKGAGKKRVDVVVFSSGSEPRLIAEAKLGGQSPKNIIADVDRVITLLKMHRKLGVDENLYGAVFFYRMLKGGTDDGLRGRAKSLLNRIKSHLVTQKAQTGHEWLKARADLLTRESVAEPVHAYEEVHDDGSTEKIFSRTRYAFAPGLILLGQADDVETVPF